METLTTTNGKFTGSILAAFAINNGIEEVHIANSQCKLLLDLDAELGYGLTELIGSVYSKTVVSSLVAWRFISADNKTDLNDMLNYCENVQAAVAMFERRAAAKEKLTAREADVNGSMLQQASDAVNYILQTTDQSDEVVQGLNDIADKLQQTSSNVSNICEDLTKVIERYELADMAHDSIMFAVEALKANIFFE